LRNREKSAGFAFDSRRWRLALERMKTPINAATVRFYRENGYIILKGVVPPAMIDRLRMMAEAARVIAHRVHGPQAQRLQPLGDHVDITPLREFTALPDFGAAIRAILSERHFLSTPESMTVLFEPADHCWSTEWHRDVRDHIDQPVFDAVLGGGRWERVATDFANFNQYNCALYEDTSTWFVPGTHASMTDTPGQLAAARAQDRAAVENWKRERSEAEQEIFLLDYCQSMPGAVQVILQPGDLVLYRNTAWHMGNYVPYRRRATVHGQADTTEYARYKLDLADMFKRTKERLEAEGKLAAAARN
jgi:hypothetical protein